MKRSPNRHRRKAKKAALAMSARQTARQLRDVTARLAIAEPRAAEFARLESGYKSTEARYRACIEVIERIVKLIGSAQPYSGLIPIHLQRRGLPLGVQRVALAERQSYNIDEVGRSFAPRYEDLMDLMLWIDAEGPHIANDLVFCLVECKDHVAGNRFHQAMKISRAMLRLLRDEEAFVRDIGDQFARGLYRSLKEKDYFK